jgi:hypothetical protein
VQITDSSGGNIKTYSSVNSDESNNRGALNIEADIPVADFANNAGNATLRVWGVSLSEINKAAQFKNQYIYIYGGSNKGLPLENPAHSGLLYAGRILQCFGNWQDTMQCLDFVITA